METLDVGRKSEHPKFSDFQDCILLVDRCVKSQIPGMTSLVRRSEVARAHVFWTISRIYRVTTTSDNRPPVNPRTDHTSTTDVKAANDVIFIGRCQMPMQRPLHVVDRVDDSVKVRLLMLLRTDTPRSMFETLFEIVGEPTLLHRIISGAEQYLAKA